MSRKTPREDRSGRGFRVPALAVSVLVLAAFSPQAGNAEAPRKQPFFGDTHIHTTYSLDASTQGTLVTPEEAYDFARGKCLAIQPYGTDSDGDLDKSRPLRTLRLARPLDFAIVTDHAEFFGEVEICTDESRAMTDPPLAGYNSIECQFFRERPGESFLVFNFQLARDPDPSLPGERKQIRRFPYCGLGGEACLDEARNVWERIRDAAAAHNVPGEFTTLVGYEWTGSPISENLHRNVVFRNGNVPDLPVSYFDAPVVEQLWADLDEQCVESCECSGEEGCPCVSDCEAFTIPHNSNLSAGRMFRTTDDEGNPIDADYAARRQANEPLAEVFQHKGDSECDSRLEPWANDELCGFEKLPYNNLTGDRIPPLQRLPGETDFLRSALKEGLRQEAIVGANPFKYGLIGSSDTHLGAPGAVLEEGFPGHGGAGKPARTTLPQGLADLPEYNPGGLAVVWANESSRDALFEAMKSREVYATSGPRIRLRFYGGGRYGRFDCDGATERRVERVGERGASVPMGSDLPDGAQGRFLVWAVKDPGAASVDTPSGDPNKPCTPGDDSASAWRPGEPSTPLERIQIVKGWIEPDGAGGYELHEKVHDVVCSESYAGECDVKQGNGDVLCRKWIDPAFDPDQRAFYYARVLEEPTPRWTARQCEAAEPIDCASPPPGLQECCNPRYPTEVRERAWSSPIWSGPSAE